MIIIIIIVVVVVVMAIVISTTINNNDDDDDNDNIYSQQMLFCVVYNDTLFIMDIAGDLILHDDELRFNLQWQNADSSKYFDLVAYRKLLFYSCL